mgnify:FL=1
MDAQLGIASFILRMGSSMEVRVDQTTHHITMHSFSGISPSIRNLASRASPPVLESAPARTHEHLPGPPSTFQPLPAHDGQGQSMSAGPPTQPLISLTTTLLTTQQLGDLDRLAARRAEMVEEFQHLPWARRAEYMDKERAFLAAARDWLKQQRVPRTLAYALGRCLWHHSA